MGIFRDRVALGAICRRYGISSLSLFGSVLKGEQKVGSDVDLLVVFDRDAKPTLLDMARIETELSGLLGGSRVDLRTPGDLSTYFRDEILASAELQYAAG